MHTTESLNLKIDLINNLCYNYSINGEGNSIIKPSHPFSWPTRPCLLDQSEKEGQLFKPLQLFEDGSPGLRDVARVAPI